MMKSGLSRSPFAFLARRARRVRKRRLGNRKTFRLEHLEHRLLLASDFVVNSIADLEDTIDDGIIDVDPGTPGNQLSLREAIKLANGDTGSTITFDLSGSRTIIVDSELPAITAATTIDASPHVGANPITLQTSVAGAGVNGLVVQADGVVIHGLRVEGFGGAGILGDTSSDALLVLNEIVIRDNFSFGVFHRGSLHVNRAADVPSFDAISTFSGNGLDGISAGRDIVADRPIMAENNGGVGVFAGFEITAFNGITAHANGGPGIQSLFGAIELHAPTASASSPVVVVTDNGGPGILAGSDITAVATTAPGGGGAVGEDAAADDVTISTSAIISGNAGWGIMARRGDVFVNMVAESVAGSGALRSSVSDNGNVNFSSISFVNDSFEFQSIPTPNYEARGGIWAAGSVSANLIDINRNFGAGVLGNTDVQLLQPTIEDNFGTGVQAGRGNVEIINPNASFQPQIRRNAGHGVVAAAAGPNLVDIVDSELQLDGVITFIGPVFVTANAGWGLLANEDIHFAPFGSDARSSTVSSNGSASQPIQMFSPLDGDPIFSNHDPGSSGGIAAGGSITHAGGARVTASSNFGPGVFANNDVGLFSPDVFNNRGPGVQALAGDVTISSAVSSLVPEIRITRNQGPGIEAGRDAVIEASRVLVGNNGFSGVIAGRDVLRPLAVVGAQLTVSANGDSTVGPNFRVRADGSVDQLDLSELDNSSGIRASRNISLTNVIVNNNSGDGVRADGDVFVEHGQLCFNTGESALAGGTLELIDVSDCSPVFPLTAENGGPSSPSNLVSIGSQLYFSGSFSGAGSELAVSDGTPEGTRLIKDIRPGSLGSSPSAFLEFNGQVFFIANDGVHGSELWKTDGTDAGTVMVADINPNGSSISSQIAVLDNAMVFFANDGATGTELWRSDGTANGTVQIADIRVGSSSSKVTNFNELNVFNGNVYFVANDGIHGAELWRTNGEVGNAELVADTRPGSSSGGASFTRLIGDAGLFFTARPHSASFASSELYVVNHADAVVQITNTFLGSGAQPGSNVGPVDPILLAVMDGNLYFSATTVFPHPDFPDTATQSLGRELWKTDGTFEGTMLVKDIFPGSSDGRPEAAFAHEGTLYFRANDGVHGVELWKSDGSEAGTELVADITPGISSSTIQSFRAAGGKPYFVANDPVHGQELWETNGTADGTVLVADIFPGTFVAGSSEFPNSSSPDSLTEFQGTLAFTAAVANSTRRLMILRDPVDLSISSNIENDVPVGIGKISSSLSDGSQSLELVSPHGFATRFRVRVENPGDGARAFLFKVGQEVVEDPNASSLTYFDLASPTGTLAEITEAMRGDGFLTPEIAPRDFYEITVVALHGEAATSLSEAKATVQVFAPDAPDVALDTVTAIAVAGLIVNTGDDAANGVDPFAFSVVDSDPNQPGQQISLRAAIQLAESTPGFVEAIRFNLPATANGDPPTIQINTALPDLTQPVILDGRSQGSNRIVLFGNGGNYPGLRLLGGDSLVAGLVINGFGAGGIQIESDNNVIEGNFIGTDRDGMTAVANGAAGVAIVGGSGNRIGGALPEQGNIISGNVAHGIFLSDAEQNIIAGNLIGLGSDGVTPLGNGGAGVFLDFASANLIGLSVDNPDGAPNVIGNNALAGIHLQAGSDVNSIHGNLIGVASDGESFAGNLGDGIRIESGLQNIVGFIPHVPVVPLEANTIAFNAGAGVIVLAATGGAENAGNSISGNSIYGNNGLGIDLNADGRTVNVSPIPRTGANGLQNAPVISLIDEDSTSVTVSGSLHSVAGTTFDVEFFYTDTANATRIEHGNQGQEYVHSIEVTTDSSGVVHFQTVIPIARGGEQTLITATARDANGNTSEFSTPTPDFRLVSGEDIRTPVVVVPGIFGSFPDVSSAIPILGLEYIDWLLKRGFDENGLTIDPVGLVYRDMIQTLENSGYVQGVDLIVVPYDWRVPVAPANASTPRNGRLDILTAERLTDGQFEFGVDYLGEALKATAENWFARHGQPLTEVHYIGHSMGGLVGRSYLQSAAYGQLFNSALAGRDLPLPLVSSFTTIGTPHQGASGSWNAWHDNFNRDPASRLVLSKVMNHAFQKMNAGGAIFNPDGTFIDLSDEPTFEDQKVAFVRQYAEAIGNLLPTYNFATNFVPTVDLNGTTTTENTNHLLEVLNANSGVVKHVPKVARNVVIYGASHATPDRVQLATGTVLDLFVPDTGEIVSFDSLTARDAEPGEQYFVDLIGVGDETVPLISSEGLFLGDGITELIGFAEPGKARAGDSTTSFGITHTGLMSNADVQATVRNLLVQPSSRGAISTQGQRGIGDAFGSVLAPILTFNLIVDPVDALLVDNQGRRLGYTEETGPLEEIPNSVYLGGADGIGWVFDPEDGPYTLQLKGLGEQHYVQLTSQFGLQADGLIDTSPLADGETRTLLIEPLVIPDPVDLSVAFVDPPTTTVGQDTTYTLSVENLGPNVSPDSILLIQFDSPMELVSAPAGSESDNLRLEIPIGNLNPQTGQTISFTIRPSQAGDLGVQAILAGGTDTTEININTNLAAVVTFVNDNPVAVDDTVLTDEDIAFTINVLTNDSDVDGDTLTPAIATGPSNGSASVNTDGTITYTPNANFNGSDSFTYTVSDGNGGSATATANITITPVNDAPIATILGTPAIGSEGTVINLSSSIVDPDTGDMHVSTWNVAKDGAGFVSGSGNAFAFTPDDNGSYQVTLTVTDAGGLVGTDIVNITVNNAPPTAFITGPDSVILGESATFTLTANDPSSVDQASDFMFAIDWDGDGVIDETIIGPSGTTAARVFTEEGDHDMIVTATDKDNATSDATVLSIDVVRDGGGGGEPGTAEIVNGDLVVTGTDGNDRITIRPDRKNPGQVKVRINRVLVGSFAPTGIIRVDAGLGNDEVYVSKHLTIDSILDGGDGNDFLRGGGGNDLLRGGEGNDELRATVGNDVLEGGAGNDLLRAGQGDDLLDGGDGDDELRGYRGNDILIGGAGNDLLRAGEGNDQLFGGDGDDELRGHRGNDLLDGGAGNDLIRGGKDGDVIDGGAGNDVIFGGSGDDLIRGGDGDDEIHGGRGDDILLGGNGYDRIDGGGGRDLMIGGQGEDWLRGQGDEDILIGGRTDYDANDEALKVLLAEWSRSICYDDRVRNVTSGTGTLLGRGVRLDHSTVHDDDACDLLEGDGHTDLFFYNYSGAGIKDRAKDIKRAGRRAESRVDID